MNSLILKTSLAGAYLVFSSVLSHAADPDSEPLQERYGSVSGNIAIWGQYVRGSDFREKYDLGGGSYDYSDCSNTENFCGGVEGAGGDARLHFAIGNGHALQLEALVDWHDPIDEDDEGEYASYTAGGGHWIYRTGAMAFGAFGGLSYSTHLSETKNASAHAFGGGEIAAFLGDATLFGQLGYASATGGEDYVDDLVFGRVGARYFVTDNDRIEGWAGYGYSDKAEEDDDAELDWFQLAVNYEHQLATLPMSLFAGYQGDYVERQETGNWDDSGRAWVHTFKVGLRASFGGTLKHEDREGARTFDFMNMRAPLSYADDLE